MRRFLLLVAGVTVVSCGSPAAPGAPTSPSFPTVLLTTNYSLLCQSDWIPSKPSVPRAVFDFWLPSTTTADAERAIRDAGGKIDYVFHVPIVRAEVGVEAAKTLWADNVAYGVFSVPDFANHSVSIIVQYDHAETAADEAALTALGGTSLLTFKIIRQFMGVEIADEQVAAILQLPGVIGVENNARGCLDGVEARRLLPVTGSPLR